METNEKANKTERSLRLWSFGMVLLGLFQFVLQAPIETIVMTVGFGLAVIFGKRVYGIYQIGYFFLIFLIGAAVTWAYYNTAIEVVRVRQIYFIISSIYYTGFFVFFRRSEVKQIFHPPIPKPLPTLTQAEEKRIKFWVKVIAGVILLESVGSYLHFEWFKQHGLPPEGPLGAILGVIAALGLLFLRQNTSRKLGLFVYMGGGGRCGSYQSSFWSLGIRLYHRAYSFLFPEFSFSSPSQNQSRV